MLIGQSARIPATMYASGGRKSSKVFAPRTMAIILFLLWHSNIITTPPHLAFNDRQFPKTKFTDIWLVPYNQRANYTADKSANFDQMQIILCLWFYIFGERPQTWKPILVIDRRFNFCFRWCIFRHPKGRRPKSMQRKKFGKIPFTEWKTGQLHFSSLITSRYHCVHIKSRRNFCVESVHRKWVFCMAIKYVYMKSRKGKNGFT